jgi:hypothetical protein
MTQVTNRSARREQNGSRWKEPCRRIRKSALRQASRSTFNVASRVTGEVRGRDPRDTLAIVIGRIGSILGCASADNAGETRCRCPCPSGRQFPKTCCGGNIIAQLRDRKSVGAHAMSTCGSSSSSGRRRLPNSAWARTRPPRAAKSGASIRSSGVMSTLTAMKSRIAKSQARCASV